MHTPRAQWMESPGAERAAVASPLPPRHEAPASGVSVRVGRLVLNGFDLPPGGAGLVRVAFQQELIRLLSAGDLPPGMEVGGARRRLPGGPLAVGAWTDPTDLGSRIARAIHDGMGR